MYLSGSLTHSRTHSNTLPHSHSQPYITIHSIQYFLLSVLCVCMCVCVCVCMYIIDFKNGTLSFCKNGAHTGIAFRNLKGPVRGAVSVYAEGSKVCI